MEHSGQVHLKSGQSVVKEFKALPLMVGAGDLFLSLVSFAVILLSHSLCFPPPKDDYADNDLY